MVCKISIGYFFALFFFWILFPRVIQFIYFFFFHILIEFQQDTRKINIVFFERVKSVARNTVQKIIIIMIDWQRPNKRTFTRNNAPTQTEWKRPKLKLNKWNVAWCLELTSRYGLCGSLSFIALAYHIPISLDSLNRRTEYREPVILWFADTNTMNIFTSCGTLVYYLIWRGESVLRSFRIFGHPIWNMHRFFFFGSRAKESHDCFIVRQVKTLSFALLPVDRINLLSYWFSFRMCFDLKIFAVWS